LSSLSLIGFQGMETKVIIVTGAFGALGQAIVRAGADEGARVVAIGRGKAPADLVGAALVIGGTDLTDAGYAEAAVKAVIVKFGRLDAVLNAVGGFSWKKTADTEAADWEHMHRLNLLTVLNISRAALPALAASGAGAIVNVGALGALQAGAGMGPYAASKSALHKLTEALADEVKSEGVTVNAVLPSTIDTAANRAEMGEKNAAKWVDPTRLAKVMLFLAGPGARDVTGALIPVRGRV